MAAPSRRVHARLPCDLPVSVWSEDGKSKLSEGRCLDIGMGGALFACPAQLMKGSVCILRLGDDKNAFEAPGLVTHAEKKAGASSYGMRFDLNLKQVERLKLVVDKIRLARPDDQMGEKIKTYWW